MAGCIPALSEYPGKKEFLKETTPTKTKRTGEEAMAPWGLESG